MARPHYATQYKHPVDESALGFGFGEYGFSVNGTELYHLGDDYEVFLTAVYPIANGYVIEADYNDSFGNYVIVRHEMPNGDNIYSLYAHLDSIATELDAVDPDAGIEVKVYYDQDWALGISGNTGDANGYHLHLEVAENNLFNGPGVDYARGYDAATSPALGSISGYDDDGRPIFEPGNEVFDPSDFIGAYSRPGAVQRDYAPIGGSNLPDQAPDIADDRGGHRIELDFDDLFDFDTSGLVYDGLGYFGDVDDKVDGFEFINFAALHTPSYAEQDGGYVNGTTSGDWVAFNRGGSPAVIVGEDSFYFREATFTAAWEDDLDLTITAYDLEGTVYVERATETINLNTDDPIRWSFGSEYRDIEAVVFETSGGVPDPTLISFGNHFAMDDMLFIA